MKKIIIILLCTVLLIGCAPTNYVNNSNVNLEIENTFDQINKEEKSEILQEIAEIKYNWIEGILEYVVAIEQLKEYKGLDKDIDILVDNFIEEINDYQNNTTLFYNAQKMYDDNQFYSAMIELNKIDSEYVNYDITRDLFNACERIIIENTNTASTLEEYDAYIKEIDENLKVISTDKLRMQSTILKDRYAVMLESDSIIDEAVKLYEKGHYKAAFKTLEDGINQYPNNEILKENYNNMLGYYLITISDQVASLFEKKEYDDAVLLINNSLKHYECDELVVLKEVIKEKKDPVYKIKKDTINFLNNLSDDWNFENIDVVKAAQEAGTYILETGEKIILGDYSDEEVTVMVAGGNILLALTSLDALFDIRDLVYDVTHYNGEEYFLLKIGFDLVVLLPVIGTIKYIEIADTIKDTTKNFDKVLDVIKNSELIAITLKVDYDSFKDIKNIKDIIKKAGNITDTVDGKSTIKLLKKAEPRIIITNNSNVVDGVHKVTGVKFYKKVVRCDTVGDVKGYFPKFTSKHNFKLEVEDYKKSRNVQSRLCNKGLYSEILESKTLKKKYSVEDIEMLKKGDTPKGYIWHHNEEEGLMQLVDKEIHEKTSHTGGYKIWGEEAFKEYQSIGAN